MWPVNIDKGGLSSQNGVRGRAVHGSLMELGHNREIDGLNRSCRNWQLWQIGS